MRCSSRHFDPRIRPHLTKSIMKNAWQFNPYTERFEISVNVPITLRLGSDNAIRGVGGDRIVIRAVHDNGLCESEPLQNCGWHHNPQNPRAVFHTQPHTSRTTAVTWNLHSAVSVSMEDACEITLVFVCNSSELQNGGNREGNRKWLMQLEGTFLGHHLTVDVPIQVFSMLRPIARLRKAMIKHERATESTAEHEGRPIQDLRDAYVRAMTKASRKKVNKITCRNTLLTMLELLQPTSNRNPTNSPSEDEYEDDL